MTSLIVDHRVRQGGAESVRVVVALGRPCHDVQPVQLGERGERGHEVAVPVIHVEEQLRQPVVLTKGHAPAEGLLRRVAHPSRPRAKLLELTDSGRARLARVRQHQRKALEERRGRWPDEDVDTLCRENGAMPRLVLHVIKQNQAPMHQHHRLAVLRRVLYDEPPPLHGLLTHSDKSRYPSRNTRHLKAESWALLSDHGEARSRRKPARYSVGRTPKCRVKSPANVP